MSFNFYISSFHFSLSFSNFVMWFCHYIFFKFMSFYICYYIFYIFFNNNNTGKSGNSIEKTDSVDVFYFYLKLFNHNNSVCFESTLSFIQVFEVTPSNM